MRSISSVFFGQGSSDPRILTNSCMWQSERWNRAVKRIPASKGYAESIALALQLVRHRRHYDVVYTVGVRETQIYGLVCAVVGMGGVPHVATEILLDETQSHNLAWRLKCVVRRLAFRKTAAVIVFSRGERELYSRELQLPSDRIRFVPFHTNIQQPRFTPAGSYGFAAGRSLRDYKTFFAAAEQMDFPFVVVADRDSVAHLRIPDNVELHCDVPRSKYLELLEGSHFVIVPLEAEHRSSGQVVVLEAMALGKPVIASDVVGVQDYISHGVDGLLVPPSDPGALRSSIQSLIADDALGLGLARSAMQRVKRDHTFDSFAAECMDIISEACRQQSGFDIGDRAARDAVSAPTEEALLEKELTRS
jgi:glycosyltransferase involved in cell wall biosynthesis